VAPTLTLETTAPQVAPGDMVICSITASEDIGWGSAKFTITGGTATGWLMQDARHYSFQAYAQATPGTMTVTIPQRAGTDLVGNFFAQPVSISVPIIAP